MAYIFVSSTAMVDIYLCQMDDLPLKNIVFFSQLHLSLLPPSNICGGEVPIQTEDEHFNRTFLLFTSE